jgi:hypothetical protein
MPITLDGTNGITTPTYGGADTAEYLVPVTGFKNRIINGAMVISQRNGTSSVTPTDLAYTLDRWQARLSQASKFSVQQDAGAVTPPAGFTDYLGVTSLSAYSVGSAELFYIRQSIEGFNIADLDWGTANAKTVTISFWVRSSLTGTFGGSVNNSAVDRSYPFSYSISSANTWEQKSVTIAGDTTGTWLTTNGAGVRLIFGLGIGSTLSGTANTWQAGTYYSPTGATSVVGTNGATFYITGVQLEVGSTATSFDYRPYGTELALCQRYYYRITPQAAAEVYGSGYCVSTTQFRNVTQFAIPMRAAPTALEQSGTASDYTVLVSGATVTCSAVPTFSVAGLTTAALNLTVASGLTAGQGGAGRAANTSAYLGWSAEL